MRAKKELRRSFLAPEARDQVYERHHSSWCRRGKLRSACRPPGRLQLVYDINARLFQCLCAGRPRGEINQQLNMAKRFCAEKIFPHRGVSGPPPASDYEDREAEH